MRVLFLLLGIVPSIASVLSCDSNVAPNLAWEDAGYILDIQEDLGVIHVAGVETGNMLLRLESFDTRGTPVPHGIQLLTSENTASIVDCEQASVKSIGATGDSLTAQFVMLDDSVAHLELHITVVNDATVTHTAMPLSNSSVKTRRLEDGEVDTDEDICQFGIPVLQDNICMLQATGRWIAQNPELAAGGGILGAGFTSWLIWFITTTIIQWIQEAYYS